MKFLCLIFVTSIVSAHFTLDYPPTTGFDEDQEPNPPCGGFPPDLSNLTAWPLSGGEISVDLHHPEALFLFRAQLVGSDDWFNLSDGIVDMVGLGEGCIHSLPVPQNWSGMVGVIQVVGQPPDGILYQVIPALNVTDCSVPAWFLRPARLVRQAFVLTGVESRLPIHHNSSRFQISASTLSGPKLLPHPRRVARPPQVDHPQQARARQLLPRAAQGLFVLSTVSWFL